MKIFCVTFIALIAAAALVHAQNDTTPAPPAGNGTTTVAPETSKPSNDTTTTPAATTTTPPVTTSSTQAPATTTALPAEPKAGEWHVTDNKTVCILVKMGARFIFNYTKTGGKAASVTYDMPADNATTAEGVCGNSTIPPKIKLSFHNGWTFSMTFQQKSKKFSVKKIELNVPVTSQYFPDAPSNLTTITGNLDNQTLFQANVDQSYLCNAEQTFTLNPNINQLKLETADVQIQAYKTGSDTDFGTAQECPADAETSNIVPIAVGAALAALVLIVLIAYLISRNRSQRGYESV